MQSLIDSSRMLLFFALSLLIVAAPADAGTPVQKVIEILNNMKAKGVKEMEVEQMIFKDYTEFVDDRTAELGFEIKTAKASIEKLTAFIEKADSDIAEMATQLANLDSEINTMEADSKAATEQRDVERATFLQDQTDYEESLYALDRAISVLKAQDYDRPQAMMMLQKMATTVRGMRHVLAALALVQESSKLSQPSGAPEVAAYEFESSGIIDLLEQMKARFKSELGEMEKEEMNKQHAYDMEVTHLTNTIASTKADREEVTATKAKTAAASATAKGELADTKESLAEAEKFLADMTATYAAKKATFEENQKVRKEELSAISKAIEIISDPTVTDAYSSHVKVLLQAPSLLQLGTAARRTAARRTAAQNQAAVLLRQRAEALSSKVLSRVAQQVAESPFAKVIEMIEDLLARLKEEAASEADHKAWCDEELAANKIKREKKSAKVDQLRAEIEAKTVTIAKMGEEISTLADEQADLKKAMAEATAVRTKEKEANKEAISDSKDALTAVKQAILVLKDFYAKQALMQVGVKQVPEMAEYNGMAAGTQGGVIGMLEVIESDFARVIADTTAAEDQASSLYTKFMSDAKADVEAKHKAEFKLSLAKDQAEFEEEVLEKDLSATQEQLDMANKYFSELKPQCLEVHVSFEERAARRQEEIKALQEAYKILDGKQ